eukprot:305740-Rhodomonas_salina.4
MLPGRGSARRGEGGEARPRGGHTGIAPYQPPPIGLRTPYAMSGTDLGRAPAPCVHCVPGTWCPDIDSTPFFFPSDLALVLVWLGMGTRRLVTDSGLARDRGCYESSPRRKHHPPRAQAQQRAAGRKVRARCEIKSDNPAAPYCLYQACRLSPLIPRVSASGIGLGSATSVCRGGQVCAVCPRVCCVCSTEPAHGALSSRMVLRHVGY